jgi:hypothetical protein
MRTIVVAPLVILIAIWTCSSVWAQAVPPIGKIVSATGMVTVEHTEAVVLQANLPSGPIEAKIGDLVFQGDVLNTGPDTKVSITFTDGTAFNLSPNARMELNEFVYDAKSQSNSSLFSIAKGTFTFVAGNVAKSGDMKVDTPVGIMGIRGTTPHVEVLEDGKTSFSTLIEDKDNTPTMRPSPAQPSNRAAPARARTRNAGSPAELTPKQADAYDRLFKFKTKLCKGC